MDIRIRNAAFDALNNPLEHSWTVQGFGMLRTYLDPDKRYRLNIWHSALAVPGVSIIHDHPWHFTSLVIAGAFANQRYTVAPALDWSPPGAPIPAPPTHHYQWIKTGEGGGPKGNVCSAVLTPGPLEVYTVGDTYAQTRDEVHASFYADGTCTLNDRTERVGEDARVFWPYGQKWVDAEPRAATATEVVYALTAVRQRIARVIP
jgi:hypothetical protein